MTTKILIIGEDNNTALTRQMIKEKFGDDIILVTPKEAKEQGLIPDDFANIPRMKITAPPVFEAAKLYGCEMSGKEKRRLRRKNQRAKRK